MLKHLTERQKHNLIKHFEQSHESEKRGQKKKKYVELNYVHMWNRYTSTAQHTFTRSFARSLTYYIHNGPLLPSPPSSSSLTKISAIVAIFRKFVPKTMRWWNQHATKLEFHFYVHSSCVLHSGLTHTLTQWEQRRKTWHRILLIYATFVFHFKNWLN